MPTRFEDDDPLRIGDRIDAIETWGDWTDDVIVQRHQCPFNINDEIGILHREANERGPATWILAILEMELATEDETGSAFAHFVA